MPCSPGKDILILSWGVLAGQVGIQHPGQVGIHPGVGVDAVRIPGVGVAAVRIPEVGTEPGLGGTGCKVAVLGTGLDRVAVLPWSLSSDWLAVCTHGQLTFVLRIKHKENPMHYFVILRVNKHLHVCSFFELK